MPLILLTNDDGIEAEGIRRLEESLSNLADLLVVAPDRERSAVSHGLTIHSPLTLNNIGPGRYTLNGTPADCVIYALERLTTQPPDLIVSGINHGANLGDDIMYSGTVAAAREASRHGVPALAVSQAFDERPIQFDAGVKFIRRLVENLLQRGAENGAVCLNVNIPVRKIKGVKITRQGIRSHFMNFRAPASRNGGQGSDGESRNAAIPLDFEAILAHHVSITPLQRDQTDYGAAQNLLKEAPHLF